jgi:hypothetical protein
VAGTRGSSSGGPNPGSASVADRDELIRAASRISAEQRATHGGSSPCQPSPGLQQNESSNTLGKPFPAALPGISRTSIASQGLQQHGSERASEHMQRAGEERLWPVSPREQRDRQASYQVVTNNKAICYSPNTQGTEKEQHRTNEDKNKARRSGSGQRSAVEATNQVIQNLISQSPRLAWLPPAWRQGTILAPVAALQLVPGSGTIFGLGTFWSEEATSGSRETS